MSSVELTDLLERTFGGMPVNGMSWAQLTSEALKSSTSTKLNCANLIFVLYVADAAARRHSTLEFLMTPPQEADDREKWNAARNLYESIWGNKLGAIVHRWSDNYVPGYSLSELRHGLAVKDCNYYSSMERDIKHISEKLAHSKFKTSYYGEDLGYLIVEMLRMLSRSGGAMDIRRAEREDLIIFYSARQAWSFFADRCFCASIPN